MSQALPADLINPSIPDLTRASDDNVNFTSPEELHRFWKVYEAQRDYVRDSSVSRLRNLFWRIWSSKSLARSISNEKLNQLWMRCRRNQAFVPFQLPGAFLQRYPQRPTQAASSSVTREQDLHHAEVRPDDRVAGSVTSRAERPRPMHPTLADRITERTSDDRPSQACRGGSSSASTASTESSNRPTLRRNTSGTKGRPPVLATAGRGRAKPTLMRRKSSQNKGQANAERQSEPTLMPPILKTASQEMQNAGSDAPAPREPAFAFPPASSWQDVEESSPKQPSPIAERAGSLVDRNFRSRFLSSATNLPAMGRMRNTGSVVRFADEDEEIGKGKGKEASPPDSPQSLRSRGRTGSQVIDSDESSENEGSQLRRTTSQLSMAINDRRKQSGSRDLGFGPGAPAEAGKKDESKRREEELLKMGRTAAGPTIPKGRTGSGEDPGYRSPSPGPTF